MTEPTTTGVDQTIRIAARPGTVWRYWTDPERMCDWWGSAADLDPRPGGVCHVTMDQGPVMRGEFVELVPHERIVFTFGWDAPGGDHGVPPGSSLVEITLAADANDTIMTLRHTGLPPVAVDEHSAGWAHFLSLLTDAAGRHEPRSAEAAR